MTKWHSKLAVVLDNFLASRKGKPDLHFWDTVALDWSPPAVDCDSNPYLTGWITTFSLFSSSGNVIGFPRPDFECDYDYDDYDDAPARKTCKKDAGRKWWHIDSEDIADNVISVPIKVNDNGVEYSTRMFIGQLMSEFEEGLDREGKEKEMLERQGITGTKNVLTPRTDYALVVQGLQADVDRLIEEGKGESGSNEKEFKEL